MSGSRVALLFFGVGFASQTTQVILFRESFLNLNGSELAFGFVLAVWLLWGAVGSFVGALIRRGMMVFLVSAGALVALLPVTTHMLRISRSLLQLQAGQAPSVVSTLLFCALVCFPVVFLCGFLFSVGLAVNREVADIPAARCYGLDALGDVAAGALSAALLALGVNHFLLAAIGCVVLAVAVALLLDIPICRFACPELVAAHLVLSFPLEDASQHSRWRSFNPQFRLLQLVNSPYGETAVVTMGGAQSDIFRNGVYLFSVTPEGEAYEAAKPAHALLCAHPAPQSLLLVGESPDMLPEILRHPIKRLDCVWLDPALGEVLGRLKSQPLQNALRDDRLQIHNCDPRRFIHQSHTTWDIIAITGGLPSTIAQNRLFTAEFARIAKRHLNKNGVLAFVVHTVPSMQEVELRRVAVLLKTLKSVFGNVRATIGGWLFASDSPIEVSAAVFESRYRERGVSSRNFVPEYFSTLFYERDQRRLERYVEAFVEDAPLNTDADPALVRSELLFLGRLISAADKAMVAAMMKLRLWHMLVGLGALCGLFFLRRARVYGAVAVAGFSGLAASLVVLHLFQATVGATYLALGLLTALFMLGLSAGARWASDVGLLWRFAPLGLAVVVLAAFLLGPFSGTLLFVLNFCGGFCVGAVYSRASRILGGVSGGLLFGCDLGGATAAAVLVGCALVMTAGISAVVAVTATAAAVATILMR